jgi:integrase
METEKIKRPRGSGSIFHNGSAVWWVKFSHDGIARRESSYSTDRKVAEKLLALRLAEVKTDTFVPRRSIPVDELIADLLSEYQEKQQKSTTCVRARWRLHLQPFFTKKRASDVSTDMVRRYIKLRTEQSASPATINRELAVLKRAFNAARESTPPKVKMVPYIPMFQERNVRTGFLRDEQYDQLAAEAAREGLWLRALLAVAYNFGLRKSEMLGLRVHQVDLISRTITLLVGETKNNSGRKVIMTDEVFTLVSALVAGKAESDHVFTRPNGRPVKNLRRPWQKITEAAGVPGLLLHDLRRTGVRNLRRLGVAESVAMKISGHKTASIFRRYDITDEADLIEVAQRLDEKRQLLAEKKVQGPEFGLSSGRTAPKTGNPQMAPSLAPRLN